VREYAQLEASFHQFEKEFNHLAEKALLGALFGFMHRDLQSRNIMIHQDEPYFIDFQGGRLGPLQYDLASLLIDPYVNLAEAMQRSLLNYCVKSLSLTKNIDPFAFEQCFSYCALARNLQMLGAFGFLSLRKQKPYFKKYIPIALKSLKNRLDQFKPAEFGQLRLLVDKLMDKSWN
jgi:aminoglycoside/choline kinase family phosphotransferase